MHAFGSTESDFAELAVLMRRHAAAHPGAQFREPISVDEVMVSRPIATPLKILDCCPVSDGACAVIVGREPGLHPPVRIRSAAQVHRFQHITTAPDLTRYGAAECTARALAAAGRTLDDIECAAVYDSFTVTLALLLEEIGYGMDLTACALTGVAEDLAWVSPRTGRAVAAATARVDRLQAGRIPGQQQLHRVAWECLRAPTRAELMT
jgi:acetyl-CoA acetyltransferase